MGFADNMKAFAAEVEEGHRARSAAVADVHASTVRLLDGARQFVQEITREHHKRGEQVRSTLADSRRERQSQVRELRHSIGQRLHDMQQQLHEMLRDNQNERHEHLGELMSAFEGARKALADDLREAGRLWRNRARR